MATLTVRRLRDHTRDAIRIRAAARGRSMEAEAREALEREYGDGAPKRATPEEIHARVKAVQAEVREMFGGEMPKGRVDAFLAEKRAEAARGE